MGKAVWIWLLFIGIVVGLLTFDLGVLHKDDHEIEVRESLFLSAGYISVALLFGTWVWWYLGATRQTLPPTRLNKQKLPDKPPTLNEVVRLVARLGGFLARTGDGEPGVKTIWLGMQRILDFAAGIRFSRELQAQGTCV